jgi:hypothetical protein
MVRSMSFNALTILDATLTVLIGVSSTVFREVGDRGGG